MVGADAAARAALPTGMVGADAAATVAAEGAPGGTDSAGDPGAVAVDGPDAGGPGCAGEPGRSGGGRRRRGRRSGRENGRRRLAAGRGRRAGRAGSGSGDPGQWLGVRLWVQSAAEHRGRQVLTPQFGGRWRCAIRTRSAPRQWHGWPGGRSVRAASGIPGVCGFSALGRALRFRCHRGVFRSAAPQARRLAARGIPRLDPRYRPRRVPVPRGAVHRARASAVIQAGASAVIRVCAAAVVRAAAGAGVSAAAIGRGHPGAGGQVCGAALGTRAASVRWARAASVRRARGTDFPGGWADVPGGLADILPAGGGAVGRGCTAPGGPVTRLDAVPRARRGAGAPAAGSVLPRGVPPPLGFVAFELDSDRGEDTLAQVFRNDPKLDLRRWPG